MRRLYLALVLLSLLLTTVACSGRPNPVHDYLAANHTTLNVDEPDLNLMKTDIDHAEIILAGEYHAVKANYDAKFALLTALHQQAGVRYLLSEMGYTMGALFNDYLKS